MSLLYVNELFTLFVGVCGMKLTAFELRYSYFLPR